ncbi:MAG: hypothetical protein AAF458_21800 [Pseudomonadota bacterium]
MNGGKLVTCILPKGTAVPALHALRAEFDIQACNINNARGVGRITPLRERGIGDQSEKEVLRFVVADEIADAAFEFIYHEAHVDRPHGGIIYMSALNRTTEFVLPDLPEEEN